MRNAAFTLGLFFAAAGLAGTARATTAVSPDASENGPASATVRYHENELATSQGAERLYSNLDRTAHDLCDDTGEFDLRASFAACERQAIADAVEQVDNVKLTEIYNEHFPKAP